MDLKNQSVVIDGKPWHRASKCCHPPDYMDIEIDDDVKTVYDVLILGKKLSDNGPFLGARTGPNNEYEWLTYGEVLKQGEHFGSALIKLGLQGTADKKSFVGIYSANRPEWVVTDVGCYTYSMVSVPVYDTLGEEAVVYILNQCEIEALLIDNEEKLKKLISLKPKLPKLSTVIICQSLSPDTKDSATKASISVFEFKEFLEVGENSLMKPNPSKPNDLYTICYTSGSTGLPKGVMSSHRSFVCMAVGTYQQVATAAKIGTDDVMISYLPLAHALDRAFHVVMAINGGKIGYSRGNIKLLSDDVATLKPTVYPCVPRILNRIYDEVNNAVKGSVVMKTLLQWALFSKLKQLDRGIVNRTTVWDRTVLKMLQAKLGGRVRIMATGSAPLSNEVMRFLKGACGCYVFEGYGQTEAGAAATLTNGLDTKGGHIGVPIPGCQIKLDDVPEMEYFAKDGIGEILVKGEGVFEGYYKQPAKTEEALDKDGWLHTGDIGTWLPNGTLKIVDRKKNIFKLAQGEYIAPEKIESVYLNHPLVAQCFVDGDSLRPCVMGVLVLDPLLVTKWAENNALTVKREEFFTNEKVKEAVIKTIHDAGKQGGLKGFEQVKDIILESRVFSIDNDLLTPTLKNKRPSLRKFYQPAIEELYKKHGL